MNAVDTNVLLYSIDRNQPAKQLIAQQLLHQMQARLTPSVFSQHIQAFRHLFPLALPTAEAFDAALGLAEQFSLSHWDSMIFGAREAAGVTYLYTEDMGAPRNIGGIELVNPFA